MRLPILASLSATIAIAPAAAQTFDPSYPVCLQVYGRISYIECRYTSLAQCNVSAAGRAAQCISNPHFSTARAPRRTFGHDHYRYDD
jgi:hypothetical protein